MLIEELAGYRERYPEERAVTDRFSKFVMGEERCFERSCEYAHITGSAWIVDEAGEKVLLTHHAKLNRWLQLGGHADGESNVYEVALKEAEEESGLAGFERVHPGIFDIDIHPIPARKSEAAHLHYDVRYVLRIGSETMYTVSEESHDLAWVPLDEVVKFTVEESMMRMVGKWKAQAFALR